MNIVDFIFVRLVTLQMRFLKKNLLESKFSGVLLIGLFLGFFIIGIYLGISLLNRNILADMITHNNFIAIFIIILCTLLLIYRYFYFIDFESLGDKYLKIKWKILYCLLSILLSIFIMIESFCFFRLYKYGYIF